MKLKYFNEVDLKEIKSQIRLIFIDVELQSDEEHIIFRVHHKLNLIISHVRTLY